MSKSPEELYAELKAKEEQAKKDAEDVRKFIEAQKAYNELQARINGTATNSTPDIVSPSPMSKITLLKSSLILKGRKPVQAGNIIIENAMAFIKEANRFLPYSELRKAANSLEVHYPQKTSKEVEKLLRDNLFRDRNSSNAKLAYKEVIASGQRGSYIYGLKSFLDEKGNIKREHMPLT